MFRLVTVFIIGVLSSCASSAKVEEKVLTDKSKDKIISDNVSKSVETFQKSNSAKKAYENVNSQPRSITEKSAGKKVKKAKSSSNQ